LWRKEKKKKQQTPSSSCGNKFLFLLLEKRTKNCFIFFLVEAIGFLSLLLLQSLSFSLCVFHIIAEAFVVVLRSLFLSGEEARVAHVVLYTYGYIDRWIDAREDREIEREREIRGDYRALNTCV
jgi:hypothetical protein